MGPKRTRSLPLLGSVIEWQRFSHAQTALVPSDLLFDPDSLDIHKLTDPKLTELASVTRVLYATERQPRIGSDHFIDKNRARFKFLDEAFALLRVIGDRKSVV